MTFHFYCVSLKIDKDKCIHVALVVHVFIRIERNHANNV